LLNGSELFRYENRLFLVTDQGITELKLTKFGKPILSAGNTWGVMTNSTHWFDGVGVQDAMGAMFLITPFAEASCGQVRVPELDRLKPISGKAGNRFVVIIAADRKGDYRKFEFYFDPQYKTYKVWSGVADSPEINMAILPKGVCATIVKDGELVIFVPSNGSVNKVQDSKVSTDIQLGNIADKVVYVENDSVWTSRLK
jgi:hypothetical protein